MGANLVFPLNSDGTVNGPWDDALSPAFGNGAGAASPSYATDFIAATGAGGADANEIRLPTFSPATNDRVYTGIQFSHNIQIPTAGNIVLRPHVHWTFVGEPTNARTVIWKYHYVYAKIGASFASSVATATGDTYTTSADTEIRKHIVTSMGDILVAAANVGPSMCFVGTLKLDASSTVDAAIVGLVSFDLHYQMGAMGTMTEFAY